MNEYKSFGEMLNNERLKRGLTLRKYCKLNNFDPAKISKIENSLLSVPKGNEFVNKVAKSFNIKKNTNDYKYISDLANASRGEIPTDLQGNISILPALCRKARMNNLKKEDLQNLVNLITRSENAPKKKNNKRNS